MGMHDKLIFILLQHSMETYQNAFVSLQSDTSKESRINLWKKKKVSFFNSGRKKGNYDILKYQILEIIHEIVKVINLENKGTCQGC